MSNNFIVQSKIPIHLSLDGQRLSSRNSRASYISAVPNRTFNKTKCVHRQAQLLYYLLNLQIENT